MPTRREALLDAAIDVLGRHGMRGLTHRAVDAAAGMPAGSTSNYFRTRETLVTAVVARFADREQAAWEAVAGFVQPRDREGLATALAGYVRRAVGPDRTLTIARYTVFLAAALDPRLREPLAGTARVVREWGVRWLRAAGSTDPEGETRRLLDHLEGIILHQLAFPDPELDPDEAVGEAVASIVSQAAA